MPPFLSRIFFLGLLTGASSAVGEELSYAQQLPETTRNAEQNAEARRKLNEYAHASKLVVLKEGDPDQVRIRITWANFRADSIGYATKGYVFSEKSTQICRIKYPRSKPTPFTGSCAPSINLASLNTMRSTFDCDSSGGPCASEKSAKIIDNIGLLIDASGVRRSRTNLGNQLSFIERFIEALRRTPASGSDHAQSPTQILHRRFRPIFLLDFQ
jgi:hypothetical protein